MVRLTKVTDAEGYDTTYTFNAGGQLQTVTDPNGAVTTNHYDNSGRLNKVLRVFDAKLITNSTVVATYFLSLAAFSCRKRQEYPSLLSYLLA